LHKKNSEDVKQKKYGGSAKQPRGTKLGKVRNLAAGCNPNFSKEDFSIREDQVDFSKKNFSKTNDQTEIEIADGFPPLELFRSDHNSRRFSHRYE